MIQRFFQLLFPHGVRLPGPQFQQTEALLRPVPALAQPLDLQIHGIQVLGQPVLQLLPGRILHQGNALPYREPPRVDGAEHVQPVGILHLKGAVAVGFPPGERVALALVVADDRRRDAGHVGKLVDAVADGAVL